MTYQGKKSVLPAPHLKALWPSSWVSTTTVPQRRPSFWELKHQGSNYHRTELLLWGGFGTEWEEWKALRKECFKTQDWLSISWEMPYFAGRWSGTWIEEDWEKWGLGKPPEALEIFFVPWTLYILKKIFIFIWPPWLLVSSCEISSWSSLVGAHSLGSCCMWAYLPCDMWDLSFPTRNWTCIPSLQSRFLTTGPPGKSLDSLFYIYIWDISTGHHEHKAVSKIEMNSPCEVDWLRNIIQGRAVITWLFSSRASM